MSETRRLKLSELEEWKAKARRLDRAVDWISGRIDSETLAQVQSILTGKDDPLSWNSDNAGIGRGDDSKRPARDGIVR